MAALRFGLLPLAILCATGRVHAQPALKQLLNDTAPADHWIYDDYAAAVAQAKETGKPLLVLFR